MSDSEEDASNLAKKSSSSENNNINYIVFKTHFIDKISKLILTNLFYFKKGSDIYCLGRDTRKI
jgi:hypothetical protein